MRGFDEATVPALGPLHAVEPAIERITARAQFRKPAATPERGLDPGQVRWTTVNRHGLVVTKEHAAFDVGRVPIHAGAAGQPRADQADWTNDIAASYPFVGWHDVGVVVRVLVHAMFKL